MHISYKPLWHTLLERDMRKEDLRYPKMLCYTWGTFKERIGKHYEKNGIMRCVHALVRLFGWMQYDTTEQPGTR